MSGPSEGGFIYIVESDIAAIIGYTGSAKVIEISSSVGGQKTDDIAKGDFKDREKLPKVKDIELRITKPGNILHICPVLTHVTTAAAEKPISGKAKRTVKVDNLLWLRYGIKLDTAQIVRTWTSGNHALR